MRTLRVLFFFSACAAVPASADDQSPPPATATPVAPVEACKETVASDADADADSDEASSPSARVQGAYYNEIPDYMRFGVVVDRALGVELYYWPGHLAREKDLSVSDRLEGRFFHSSTTYRKLQIIEKEVNRRLERRVTHLQRINGEVPPERNRFQEYSGSKIGFLDALDLLQAARNVGIGLSAAYARQNVWEALLAVDPYFVIHEK